MLEGCLRDRMTAGAGTVVNPAQAELMYQAKAAHIISPNVNEAVIRKAKGLGILSIPGALSPGEVLDTHRYSADYVKLFPTVKMIVSCIKDLMGPISHVKLITTAGTTEESIAESAAVGYIDYGISGRSMDKHVTQEDHFEELQHRIETSVACLQKEEE